jgi:alpha-tubulin suppressor-like RCC1 family protein
VACGANHSAAVDEAARVWLWGAAECLPYGDEKVANRDMRVWHGQKMVLNDGQIQNPPKRDCGSCRYLTLCRGVLDLSIIQ